MIRVSWIVVSVPAASKPGVITGTIWGAQMNTTTANTTRPASIRLMTVDATRQARRGAPSAMRVVSTGMSADPTAPAATSW